MKKIIITYGLISGTIVAAMLVGTMSLYHSEKMQLDNGELIGYTTMVIACLLFSLGLNPYATTIWAGASASGKVSR